MRRMWLLCLVLLLSCLGGCAPAPYADMELLVEAGSVKIYGYDTQGSEEAQSLEYYCDIDSQPLLVAKHSGRTLTLELDKSEGYRPELYLRDMDGDGADEIIVMSKFYGWKIVGLRIFKLQKNAIVPFYCYPSFPFDGTKDEPGDCSDFGFRYEFLDNQQVRIIHGATDFETTASIPKHVYPDEKGLRLSGFSDFEVIDSDEDGIYEIVGSQSLGFGYKQGIGSVEMTLRFPMQEMQVAAVRFSPYE